MSVLPRHHQGQGLTQLMVGITLGLIVTLSAVKLFSLFQAQRTANGTRVHVQLGASQALAALTRDLRIAGHGLNLRSLLGCTIAPAAGSTPTAPTLALWPVLLEDGQAGTPDRLSLISAGTAQSLPPARLIRPLEVNDNTAWLNSTLGLAAGDLLVLQSTGSATCALLKVQTVQPDGYRVSHQWLSAHAATMIFPVDSRLIALGTLRHHRYSVSADHQLHIEVYDPAQRTWQSDVVGDDIVSLQVQIGYDARPGPQLTPQVTRWSSVPLDADGDGQAGTHADLLRMLAVRLAIVARARAVPDEACTPTAPVWRAADDSTGQLRDLPISVPAITDGRCYRYRVFQTELPLRNLLWADS